MSEPLTARVANATPKTKGASTEYVVLRVIDDGSQNAATFKHVSQVQARSANEAVKTAAKATEGMFVAVPARSWKPVTVKVEQTTRITLT